VVEGLTFISMKWWWRLCKARRWTTLIVLDAGSRGEYGMLHHSCMRTCLVMLAQSILVWLAEQLIVQSVKAVSVCVCVITRVAQVITAACRDL